MQPDPPAYIICIGPITSHGMQVSPKMGAQNLTLFIRVGAVAASAPMRHCIQNADIAGDMETSDKHSGRI